MRYLSGATTNPPWKASTWDGEQADLSLSYTPFRCKKFPIRLHFFFFQMMVVMKRVKWDGSTTGSKLSASIATVHDELKVLSCVEAVTGAGGVHMLASWLKAKSAER